MINKVKELIKHDEMYKSIIEKVYENPYIEIKKLTNQFTENDVAFLDSALELLISEFVILELTSQAGSTAESRIPKKILIINPEISGDLEEILEK